MARRRDILRDWLGRPALFAVWALVAWGTLLAAVAFVDTLGEGPASVWQRLWPARGASLFAWLNLACLALACLVWAGVAVLVVRFRRREALDDSGGADSRS